MTTNAIDVSRVAPSEDADNGTELTLPVDADRLGREIHSHLSPEHPVDGCVLCETEHLLAARAIRVYRKSCCDIPRDQPCCHDLPAHAFEPGCGKAIMCGPASDWTAA